MVGEYYVVMLRDVEGFFSYDLEIQLFFLSFFLS